MLAVSVVARRLGVRARAGARTADLVHLGAGGGGGGAGLGGGFPRGHELGTQRVSRPPEPGNLLSFLVSHRSGTHDRFLTSLGFRIFCDCEKSLDMAVVFAQREKFPYLGRILLHGFAETVVLRVRLRRVAALLIRVSRLEVAVTGVGVHNAVLVCSFECDRRGHWHISVRVETGELRNAFDGNQQQHLCLTHVPPFLQHPIAETNLLEHLHQRPVLALILLHSKLDRADGGSVVLGLGRSCFMFIKFKLLFVVSSVVVSVVRSFYLYHVSFAEAFGERELTPYLALLLNLSRNQHDIVQFFDIGGKLSSGNLLRSRLLGLVPAVGFECLGRADELAGDVVVDFGLALGREEDLDFTFSFDILH